MKQESFETSSQLLAFIEKWMPHFSMKEEEGLRPVQSPKKTRFRLSTGFLRVLPFLCCGGFLLSLVWEPSGHFTLPWRPEAVEFDGLLEKLCITGLVGFLTNWLAIKMLFYPRKARPLLGQGLIPARKNRIVLRLGEQISGDIINSKLIVEKIISSKLLTKRRQKFIEKLSLALEQKDFRKDLSSLIENYALPILASPAFQKNLGAIIKQIDIKDLGPLEKSLFRFYKFISGERNLHRKIEYLLGKLQTERGRYESYINKALDKLPEILEKKGEALEKNILQIIVFLLEQINVQDVIMDNLKAFDELRLEKLLWRTTSDQLIYIQYLGCFLGILGGFFLWLPMEAMLGFFSLGLLLFFFDSLLLRLRKSSVY